MRFEGMTKGTHQGIYAGFSLKRNCDGVKRELRQLCQRVNNSKLLSGDAKADETTVIAAYENMMRNQFPLQKVAFLSRRRATVLEVRDEQ